MKYHSVWCVLSNCYGRTSTYQVGTYLFISLGRLVQISFNLVKPQQNEFKNGLKFCWNGQARINLLNLSFFFTFSLIQFISDVPSQYVHVLLSFFIFRHSVIFSNFHSDISFQKITQVEKSTFSSQKYRGVGWKNDTIQKWIFFFFFINDHHLT